AAPPHEGEYCCCDQCEYHQDHGQCSAASTLAVGGAGRRGADLVGEGDRPGCPVVAGKLVLRAGHCGVDLVLGQSGGFGTVPAGLAVLDGDGEEQVHAAQAGGIGCLCRPLLLTHAVEGVHVDNPQVQVRLRTQRVDRVLDLPGLTGEHLLAGVVHHVPVQRGGLFGGGRKSEEGHT